MNIFIASVAVFKKIIFWHFGLYLIVESAERQETQVERDMQQRSAAVIILQTLRLCGVNLNQGAPSVTILTIFLFIESCNTVKMCACLSLSVGLCFIKLNSAAQMNNSRQIVIKN